MFMFLRDFVNIQYFNFSPPLFFFS